MKRGLLFTLSIWAVGATMVRATLLMPHHCPAVDAEIAVAAARDAALWIETAQFADGTYVYESTARTTSNPAATTMSAMPA